MEIIYGHQQEAERAKSAGIKQASLLPLRHTSLQTLISDKHKPEIVLQEVLTPSTYG